MNSIIYIVGLVVVIGVNIVFLWASIIGEAAFNFRK